MRFILSFKFIYIKKSFEISKMDIFVQLILIISDNKLLKKFTK